MFELLRKNSTISKFDGDNKFLSNFYMFPMRFDGVAYESSEHAYQAQKTFNMEEVEKIKNAKTPGAAKRLARTAKLRDDWEDVKVDIMRDILWAKFSIPYLSKLLLDTGNSFLIEGNTWGDTFWGMCDGKGRNILGKLLMEIREEMRKPDIIELP